ncbi:CIC11C00000003131 [Sungouiella intermedia]|uniref:CIC11C00000003131 n=1 Tax=Sungouiella intermedia TaxID=45354 RepID=A0A1L0BZL4_9ASCO|nr:CIC11C00000003131 [[Candida] intermedia]
MSNKVELVTQLAKEGETSARNGALQKLLKLVEAEAGDGPDVKEGSPLLDEEGFEIPQDKIPLDGHFSTDEMKELVKLTQEEGMLLENVEVKVLDTNKVGDKIEIVEKNDQKEEDDKKDEKNDEKDNDNKRS